MNLKDNIQNIINKINSEEELAIIFKKYEEEQDSIAYIPIGIVSGKLDENNLTFITNNITLSHLIKGPKEYGFAFSKTLTETIKNNKLVPKFIQERLMLKSLSNFTYIYAKDQNKNPVVGVQSLNDPTNIDILYEEELLNYYIKKFPSAKEIISLLKKASGKLNLDMNEISNSLKKTYSNKEQSKQILTAIWKHLNSNKSYNIFINGSEITPKKEIIKSICDNSNIPYYMVNAIENYEITDIEEMLKKLLELNNKNLDKAENTLLVIDNINKLALNDLSADSFINAQYNLAKILRGETITLHYGKHKKVYFDTSKMMIIGMGNFKDEEIKDIKINGFSKEMDIKKENKEKYKLGMLEGLFDNFNMIIQMNEPELQDYQNLLANREGAGILNNINFFNNLDIKLTLSEEVINTIAKYAYENKMSLQDLSELMENILSNASFEIAKNPDMYEELVISPETIKDNNKYKLIRRKTNEK